MRPSPSTSIGADAVFTRSTSAVPATGVVTLEVLFEGSGSGVTDDTDAVLATPASAMAGSTVPQTVTVSVAPTASEAIAQSSCEPVMVHSSFEVSGFSSAAGSGSETATADAALGPLFVTTIV